MKTLIIYKSYHRMNTEKVARAMAEAMDAKLLKVEDARPEELADYDLVGFGSGIFGIKHHRSLIKFVEKMPLSDKNVFIFSTAGTLRDANHRLLEKKLAEKGCKIVNEFACAGEYRPLGPYIDMPGPLAYIGGKNKGHPDEKDLENARAFARGLLDANPK